MTEEQREELTGLFYTDTGVKRILDWNDLIEDVFDWIEDYKDKAVKEFISNTKTKVRQLEVRQESRYLSESGFWAKRELIDINDVFNTLSNRIEKMEELK